MFRIIAHATLCHLPDFMVVGVDPNPDERRLGHDQVPGVKCAAGDETLSSTCG